jgi:hypothetical protein
MKLSLTLRDNKITPSLIVLAVFLCITSIGANILDQRREVKHNSVDIETSAFRLIDYATKTLELLLLTLPERPDRPSPVVDPQFTHDAISSIQVAAVFLSRSTKLN